MIKRIFSPYICVLMILFAVSIRAEEHSHELAGGAIKCGTPDLLSLMQNSLNSTNSIAKIQQRTIMDNSEVSSLNHFRVHYDTTGVHAINTLDEDGNNIPDYVDSTLIFLEYAWDLQIKQLGYPEPVGDNGRAGGDEIDIYLKQFGNLYGQTYPEPLTGTTATSYIEIENDFSESVFQSKGYDALKVTTAHEFFHVVQFSMYNNWDLLWWMEQTAVWMEDRTWDDVNDYIAYLHLFFNNSQTPLDSNTGDFKYGAAIWVHYLVKQFGDTIILDLWNGLKNEKSSSIVTFDNILPYGLANAFAEFAVWNYFTKDRANTVDFYSDSDLFTVDIETDISASKSPASDTLSTKKLTSRYVELLFSDVWDENDTLHVKVRPLDNGLYENTLIFFNSPDDYEIVSIDLNGTDVTIDKDWSKAILVTSCVNTLNDTYSYDFDTRILDAGIVDQQYAFSVSATYPNPFNSLTTISFTLSEPGTISVKAYDILGKKVADIFYGNLDAGEKQILWKPSELSGGVYFIEMTSPWGRKVLKTMFLK
ncbi:MXAN_6640 family putative metalloprotease [Candidatus Latescibacterota bacterium]